MGGQSLNDNSWCGWCFWSNCRAGAVGAVVCGCPRMAAEEKTLGSGMSDSSSSCRAESLMHLCYAECGVADVSKKQPPVTIECL